MEEYILKEFKEFISKGNVMDMAVGVVLAGAFAAIVNALVEFVLMPIVGLLLSGINLSDMKIVLANAGTEAEVALAYGHVIQAIISFLFIALAVFLVVKGVNKLRKPAVVEEEPAGPTETELLTEILDELRKK